MTVTFAISFSSLFLEDNHFIAFYVRQYLTDHFGTFHYRSTNFYLSVVVDQQHFVKLDGSSLLCRQTVNKQLFAGFDLELLSLNFYNNVHLLYNYTGYLRKVEAFRTLLLVYLARNKATKIHLCFFLCKFPER